MKSMYQEVLKFWFEEIDSRLWWKKDPFFDQLIIEKYTDLHQQAARCELFSWRITAQGRLAEIIVLDQFSRNMFRDTPNAFAQDSLALALAQEAVAAAADCELNALQRSFLYMPFMHSESLLIHKHAEPLFRRNGLEVSYQFELKHKQIIEKFGRYPHRNAILDRPSSELEIAFLQQANSSF